MEDTLRILLAKLDILRRRLESLPTIRITERAGIRVEIADLEKELESRKAEIE